MATRGNRKGRNGGAGGDASVPRWVRTLFDLHEERMASIERSQEVTVQEIRAEITEMKAAHEARMARLERNDLVQQQRLEEDRRQTREVIRELSRIDAERKAESALRRVEDARNRALDARNEAEHLKFMAALKAIQDKASST